MKTYEVKILARGVAPEIIKAKNQEEAIEEMYRLVRDNLDYYITVIAEEIEEDKDE